MDTGRADKLGSVGKYAGDCSAFFGMGGELKTFKYHGDMVTIVKEVKSRILKDWSETEYEVMRARVVIHPRKPKKFCAMVLRDGEWLILCSHGSDKPMLFNKPGDAEREAQEDMAHVRAIAHGDDGAWM